MKLAILDLCIWLPEYQWDQDRFGDLVATWLQRGLPEAELHVIQVVEGEDLPNVNDFDGFVLSGSDKGVYDEAPWIEPLRSFLPIAQNAKKPIFGICFGHQIMADVFGGKAEKVGTPEVGVREFDLCGTKAKAHVWHQDQVTEIPPGAEVIGSADYCPIAALNYDFPAMSVQFHPEYSPDYVSTFLRRSKGNVLSNEETDTAVSQFDQSTVSPDLFATQAADFFRTALTS